MHRRLVVTALVFALASVSCGVSRDGGQASPVSGSTSGSADDAGDGDSTPSSSAAETTTTAPTPATTGAPDDVAATVEFEDGAVTEVLHGQLNDIVVPTSEHVEFIALAYGGAVPPQLPAVVLTQAVLTEVIDNELAKIDGAASDADLEEARGLLLQQLESLLVTSADAPAEAMRLYVEVPYVPFLAELQARQIALSNQLAAGVGEGEGDPCVRHILVETEDEADEILVELAADGDFATLAAERSTGPTGPNGGDLGCAPSAGYVPEFAEAIDAAELGEYVGPIQTEFGWHVLIVDSYQVDGDTLANEAIRAGLSSVTVEVDERIGEWSTEQLIVVPVGS